MTTKYTNDHEWARQDGDTITVGITDFAQSQLGEVVFVELPDVGKEVSQGEEAAVVESVKAAGEVKAPIGGTIVEVNEALADEPEQVNEDPSGKGWFYKIQPNDDSQYVALMDEDSYQSMVADLA